MSKTELAQLVWTEKYRPSTFDELVFDKKQVLLDFMQNPVELPSFIFYSSKPGTGKTSTAKLLAKELGADLLSINASDERGIDTVREKVKNFCQSLSSIQDVKKCIFLDEADGLTKQAQESMKALIELYSKNTFFILSCNDISKIIDPIRNGRCIVINFEKPDINEIVARLAYICKNEKLSFAESELVALAQHNYPDIRSMILALQTAKIENRKTLIDVQEYTNMMKAIKEKNVAYVYETVYSGKLDLQGFVRFYFRKLFEFSDKVELDKLSRVAFLLADIEKNWAIGTNLEIVFLSNILEIMNNGQKT